MNKLTTIYLVIYEEREHIEWPYECGEEPYTVIDREINAFIDREKAETYMSNHYIHRYNGYYIDKSCNKYGHLEMKEIYIDDV